MLNGYLKCPNCGKKTLPPERVKLGYPDCLDCSKVQKYIGRRQDKHGDIEIYRENIDYFKRQLRRENTIGFAPTVPVSSPGVEQAKADWMEDKCTHYKDQVKQQKAEREEKKIRDLCEK